MLSAFLLCGNIAILLVSCGDTLRKKLHRTEVEYTIRPLCNLLTHPRAEDLSVIYKFNNVFKKILCAPKLRGFCYQNVNLEFPIQNWIEHDVCCPQKYLLGRLMNGKCCVVSNHSLLHHQVFSGIPYQSYQQEFRFPLFPISEFAFYMLFVCCLICSYILTALSLSITFPHFPQSGIILVWNTYSHPYSLWSSCSPHSHWVKRSQWRTWLNEKVSITRNSPMFRLRER